MDILILYIIIISKLILYLKLNIERKNIFILIIIGNILILYNILLYGVK